MTRIMTPRMLKKVMIDRNGLRWNTRPEKLFAEYARSRGLQLSQNVSLPFTWEGRRFTFQCDFLHPTDDSRSSLAWDENFEVDGESFHSSDRQIQKDNWKDFVKVQGGLKKVFHIPAALCEKKWWPYLDQEITKGRQSPMGAVRIVA